MTETYSEHLSRVERLLRDAQSSGRQAIDIGLPLLRALLHDAKRYAALRSHAERDYGIGGLGWEVFAAGVESFDEVMDRLIARQERACGIERKER